MKCSFSRSRRFVCVLEGLVDLFITFEREVSRMRRVNCGSVILCIAIAIA